MFFHAKMLRLLKINIGINVPKNNVDYWKVNNSLLINKEFIREAQKSIDKH